MNPAASLAQAITSLIDPALAGFIGTASLLFSMFAIAALGAWLSTFTTWGKQS